MAKISNREKILTAGVRVVHERGFGGASVRDIVQAAGVPQGSFTNHFVSKEAFGLEVLDIYFQQSVAMFAETLRNDARPPLERFGAFLDANIERASGENLCNGCMIGNFAAETSGSDAIRPHLVEIFDAVRDAIASCLKAAVAAGEVRADLDCDDVAAFLVASLQGANLLAKVERSAEPMKRLKRIALDILQR
ncbi:TetR/AcrR family transcriptional regulator [Sphingomonas sp. QA11]|uniref:TetR/AcrR family transcriptional regulator n=1 Tax=Sphingomonas sp. QA11 TaxID=2950605 RepID=UPI00234BD7B1|nr:TetR/AcrR family transcriptional regulator [Sphingomonas sp. QA11]WCM28318.1 TetR/AcrR family transcriptional regulator [Sphingomonas sp. QA11]